jgi:hypothetical protein
MNNYAVLPCRLILLTLAAVAPVVARAADELRWKFEPGLVNRYQMKQTTDVAKSGAGGEATVSSQLEIDMSWTVKEVRPDGAAVLDQRIERMRMHASTGDGQKAEIDSASKDDPQGQAALLAPLVKALTENSFKVVMTPRGEITEVQVPDAVGEALKNQPGAAQMGELASPEGFKKLVGQASFILPESLDAAKPWTSKTENKLGPLGTNVAETTYRYQGPKDVDGKSLEAFTAEVKISFSGGDIPVEVASQKSEGEILFNREAGRLQSSRIDQATELKIDVGGETVLQKFKQHLEMNWQPAEGAEK